MLMADTNVCKGTGSNIELIKHLTTVRVSDHPVHAGTEDTSGSTTISYCARKVT